MQIDDHRTGTKDWGPWATALLCAHALMAEEYHVSPKGDDAQEGSATRPFRTISAAARIAQPGDVITVHEGVYRERVNPPRGGESDSRRIVYQAAPGEKVVIKGSEIIKGWEKVEADVWKVAIPDGFFGDFNPYNDLIGGEWYHTPGDGYDRHTGAVYLNGHWLDEAKTLEQLMPSPALQDASQDMVLGGKTAGYAGRAIAATEEDTLYQTCRYDLTGYRLALPNGTYRVTLKFCEPHFDTRGKRVFNVGIQGEAVLQNFDIFAAVGKFAAHDESFEGIEVTDGHLKIDFRNRVSLACISGIVVENENYRRRINCGGPEWNGYECDLTPTGIAGHERPLWYAKVTHEHTTIWAQFKEVDPNKETVEINARQSVFYPERPGCNYITVRGFRMQHAATPWSGAMSEQVGLVGTHWSKGWVIENNVISHSMNTGITLGRYRLQGVAMPPATAPGFVRSIELALENGWSKEKIGGHIVRNNHISHCEKNGIHGSLGGIFSTIEGNTIHDIAMRGWIGGPDVAGLKLLGSHDTLIRSNHIYRCGAVGGIWLDWMAQGTRVTGNLLHDNSQDLFMEVNHGPFLIDHNLFLSSRSLSDWSQGGAYVHNLFAGHIAQRPELKRETPFHQAHSTQLAGLRNISGGDGRFFNNVFVGHEGTIPYDQVPQTMHMSGNVYLAGAKPSKHDRDALVATDFDFGIRLELKPDGWWLDLAVDSTWISKPKRAVVTTEMLGRAQIPGAPFEQPDGTPYRLETDFFGNKRDTANPTPGPFRFQGKERIHQRVWAKGREE